MTDEVLQLVRKARKGNSEAFEILLKEQYEYIYRTAYHYVSSEQDVLDSIQEATIEAYKGLSKLKNPQFFYTWYIRILIRTASKIAEKSNRFKETSIDNYLESIHVSQISQKSEQQIDLMNSFERIEKKYQEVLQLYYYQELTIEEISQLLKVPVGTVKTNLFRGKEKLRIILGDEYYDR